MSDGLKLIASILNHKSVNTLRELEPEIFIGDEVEVFEMVREHRRRYGELPDISTIEQELGKRLPRAPECVEHYRDKVTDRHFYNSILDPVNSVRDAMKSHDMEEVRDTISELSRISRGSHARQDLRTIGDLAPTILRSYRESLLQTGMNGVATGFSSLDSWTGGYQKGDLVYIIARPAMGKTWTLMHKMKAAYDAGLSCLFVSTEMTLESIAIRWYSMLAGVDPSAARKGKLSYHTRRRYEALLESSENDNRIYLYGAGFGGKVHQIDALAQELDPDIIYIDGAYLLKPNNTRSMARYEAAAYVVDDLRNLAIQRNRAVVCTSQFGRGAEKGGKKGDIENIGYTDAIGTHASLILSVLPSDPVPITWVDEHDVQQTKYISRYRKLTLMKGRDIEGNPSLWSRFSIAPWDFSETTEEEATAVIEADPLDMGFMD